PHTPRPAAMAASTATAACSRAKAGAGSITHRRYRHGRWAFRRALRPLASAASPRAQQVKARIKFWRGIARALNLPTMHAFRFFVDAGGVMAYGATQSEIYTSAAEQVKLWMALADATATRFELVINNRTAKALGVTIPPSLLTPADEAIE